jgi:hypothetical protein
MAVHVHVNFPDSPVVNTYYRGVTMNSKAEQGATGITPKKGFDAPLARIASRWDEVKVKVGGIEWALGKDIPLFLGRKTEVIVEVPVGFAEALNLQLVDTVGHAPGAVPGTGWQTTVEEQCIWNLSPEPGMRGRGKILLFCREITEVLEIEWRSLSLDIRAEVEFRLDDRVQDPNIVMTLYRGATHAFTCFPKSETALKDTLFFIEFTSDPEPLEVKLNPEEKKTLPLVSNGSLWEFICGNVEDGRVSFNVVSDVVDGYKQAFVANLVSSTP